MIEFVKLNIQAAVFVRFIFVVVDVYVIVLFISEYHVLFNPSSALLERFIIICDYDSMPYFENIAKTITRPKQDHLTNSYLQCICKVAPSDSIVFF